MSQGITSTNNYDYEWVVYCNDYKIAILNEWSKQWSQYQHSWQSEVTHILKSRILNELEDYLHK